MSMEKEQADNGALSSRDGWQHSHREESKEIYLIHAFIYNMILKRGQKHTERFTSPYSGIDDA